MPCRDFTEDSRIVTEYKDNPETKKRLNRVTALLCGLLSVMDKIERSKLLKNNNKLAAWWKTHQQHDKQRLLKEKEQKEKNKIKNNALSKLTSKERKILGL